jgi:hypothetical protein
MSPTIRARQVRCTTYIEVAIRTLPPKAKITADVCSGRRRPNVTQGKSKLTDGEAGNAPDNRGNACELHRPHIVIGLAVDDQRRRFVRPLVVPVYDGKYRSDAGGGKKISVKGKFRGEGPGSNNDREHGQGRESQCRPSLTDCHEFRGSPCVRHAVDPSVKDLRPIIL